MIWTHIVLSSTHTVSHIGKRKKMPFSIKPRTIQNHHVNDYVQRMRKIRERER